MSAKSLFVKHGPLLAAILLALAPAIAFGKKNDAIEALDQRMAAAQARYRNAQQSAPSGTDADRETDAALADMEKVIDDCSALKGCQVAPMLSAYKQALKSRWAEDNGTGDNGETFDDENDDDEQVSLERADSSAAANGDTSTSERVDALMNDQKHDFDKQVAFNSAVEAGIRVWLTDMRSQLIDSYENYMNMRDDLYTPWQQAGLPEALLFGIVAKESHGKVHAVSRTGAAGPLQFMPATARRFGMGLDDTGFDTRFDAHAVGQASAGYVREQMAAMGNSIEFTLAAYNGGEGRAARVYQQYPGRSFWDADVYRQFPAETRDYVPMVIAAGWLFLHPKQYGLKFPRVNPKPATLTLAQPTSLDALTICLGNGGTRDGFERTLRNLNPRYRTDGLLPAGTQLKANTRIVSLYKWYCTRGTRAELTAALMNARIDEAITRNGEPLPPDGTVSVGDATVLAADAPVSKYDPVTNGGALAKAQAAKTARAKAAEASKAYKVRRGDTLGTIADKHDCNLKLLAHANGLRPPGYVVKPGKVLKMASCGK